MSSYSIVVVMGNLTRDPELRYLPSGTAVVNMTLAINHVIPGKDGGEKREEVSFIDVVAFGKLAETCGERLKKGQPVLFDGRLKQNRWENQEGQKRSKIEIIANQMRFVGPSKTGAGTQPKEEEKPPYDEPGAEPGSYDDDVPF